MTRRTGLLAVLTAALLSGCGQAGTTTAKGTSVTAQPETRLTVTVDTGQGAAPVTWTLTCDPPGGDHPDAEGACRALAAAAAQHDGDPFAPVPPDTMCAQIFGGPEKATLTGSWRGTAVSATYKRSDSCEIKRWDELGAVLAPKR
ncbi:MAG: subtilase-type protease inhibitor [Actinomycetota bacterium]|nr:subtilase-type protease inhibitor [Actinomycetota bacterium]